MPKRKNLDPPVELKLSLPSSLFTRLSLLLFSDDKGRVPHGAYSEFFKALLLQYFETRDRSTAPARPIPPDDEGSIP